MSDTRPRQPHPVTYPEGCLDSSRLAALLRLEPEAIATRAYAQDSLRALETAGGSACVAIHAGSTHERLLTRIGEVMLPEHIWEWYLRGKPASAVSIVAEDPSLRGYVESRTRHMLDRLREARDMNTSAANRDFCDARVRTPRARSRDPRVLRRLSRRLRLRVPLSGTGAPT